MTTAYTAFLPEVAPHCEGAPEQVVVNAIRNSVIDFCERSWAWIYQTTAAALVASQQDYTLVVPTGTTVAQIIDGYYYGERIVPITRATVFDTLPAWRTQTGTKPKFYMANDGGKTVSFIPIPSAVSVLPIGFTFTLALKPTRASTDMTADWLYERYLEDIAHGALYRMYAMPKKAWTNANLAGTHKKLFEDGASAARVEASKSFTRSYNRNLNTGVARW